MLNIRPATPEDIPQILAFIRELAEYEKEPASAIATPADLLRDGFSEPLRFHCLIAEWQSAAADSQPTTSNQQPATSLPQPTTSNQQPATSLPAGLALYFYNYSTWRGHTGIFLEDLFVRPAFRGKGIGKALLASVAAIAVAEGCSRFEWAVLNWNTPSIDFYRSVGAEPLSEWTTMRLSGEALSRLAQPPHSSLAATYQECPR